MAGRAGVAGWRAAGMLGLLLAGPVSNAALAMVGEGADEGVEPVLSTDYAVMPAGALAARLKADRDYVAGMRAHHAGALTMSEEYLADPAARSPALRVLARSIMHNQRYEIALMDEVARRLAEPAMVVGGLAVQPSATEGLAMPLRYQRYPVPGFLEPFNPSGGAMTVRDVQFAKAMTIHHQGALDMARAYQADPAGRNTFLGLLNVDIITDQTQEIALMNRAVAAYPGDAAAVVVPASMVHGMDGMAHGGHGGAEQGGAHAGHGGSSGMAAPAVAAPPVGRGARHSGHHAH
ncbi:DUF305 domain-containing protein [Pararoseomonas indoligenes]|uniref:DUF305 domain-containing protein n=1 Tax=Roseomonas indoligenes TaxID=2820811 RepID=A0A940S640_9PROT|nr:DUF305 domain-containing protein [Pararoseomonas indoligenes]MBP0493649.1 DUF305 domain-containing protein [Pararoseomonas indoligenes]